PAPTIATLTPPSVAAASGAFTLTVTGTGFVAGSKVQVNGADRVTTFGSDAQLTAAIPASDVAAPPTLAITVSSPSPGGGVSHTLLLQVVAGIPISGRVTDSATGDGLANVGVAFYDASS